MKRQYLEWVLLTLIGAWLLRMSAPPINFGFFILCAWLPAIIIAVRFNSIYCSCSGAIMMASWFSDLPIAFLAWGWQLPVFSWLIALTYGALISAGLQVLVRNKSALSRIFGFPCVFVTFVFLGQEVFPTPLALSPLLIDSWPQFFNIGKYIGFYGLEFSIALINSTLAYILCRAATIEKISLPINRGIQRSFFSKAMLTLSVSGLAAMAIVVQYRPNNSIAEDFSPKKNINIYAVQPAISYREALRAGNSLYQRNENETIIDTLTRQALAEEQPGIILWPEGGNNYPNLALKRRRDKMKTWLVNSDSELLFSGYEVNSQGKKFNTVTQLNSQGFGKTVIKTRLAPLAEGHLSVGKPDVINTKFAKLGVAICFEALFFSHFEALTRLGAEAFIVVTDDSSFGKTHIYQRHLHYARVFAAIYQKPLVFLNNNGPSYAINYRGQLSAYDNRGDQPHVNSWQLTLPQKGTTYSEAQTFIHLFFFGLFFLLFWRSYKNQNSQRQIAFSGLPQNTPFFFPLISTLLFFAPATGIETYLLAQTRGAPLQHIILETRQRYYGETTIDAISPLFRQRNKTSCGAAAIAYALQRMGDNTFETQLLERFPSANSAGYNLMELKNIVESRGFVANAHRATLKSLPSVGQQPSVAHWKDNHYVTVIHRKDNEVVYFDPALGEVKNMNDKQFSDRWSGATLKISYDDSWLRLSRLFHPKTGKDDTQFFLGKIESEF